MNYHEISDRHPNYKINPEWSFRKKIFIFFKKHLNLRLLSIFYQVFDTLYNYYNIIFLSIQI